MTCNSSRYSGCCPAEIVFGIVCVIVVLLLRLLRCCFDLDLGALDTWLVRSRLTVSYCSDEFRGLATRTFCPLLDAHLHQPGPDLLRSRLDGHGTCGVKRRVLDHVI